VLFRSKDKLASISDEEYQKISSEIDRKYSKVGLLAQELISSWKQNEVHEFLFCSDVDESSFYTMSTHKTKLGAYRAMNKHINKLFQSERNNCIRFGKWRGFDHLFYDKGWGVKTKPLLE